MNCMMGDSTCIKLIVMQKIEIYECASFGCTYTKIGTIQRRLAWPLRKDDTQNREAFHIFWTALLGTLGRHSYFFLQTLLTSSVFKCQIWICDNILESAIIKTFWTLTIAAILLWYQKTEYICKVCGNILPREAGPTIHPQAGTSNSD